MSRDKGHLIGGERWSPVREVVRQSWDRINEQYGIIAHVNVETKSVCLDEICPFLERAKFLCVF